MTERNSDTGQTKRQGGQLILVKEIIFELRR